VIPNSRYPRYIWQVQASSDKPHGFKYALEKPGTLPFSQGLDLARAEMVFFQALDRGWQYECAKSPLTLWAD